MTVAVNFDRLAAQMKQGRDHPSEPVRATIGPLIRDDDRWSFVVAWQRLGAAAITRMTIACGDDIAAAIDCRVSCIAMLRLHRIKVSDDGLAVRHS